MRCSHKWQQVNGYSYVYCPRCQWYLTAPWPFIQGLLVGKYKV